MQITIKNRFIIALAWGPRRLSSNTRYGVVKSPNPAYVTASSSLWLSWFKSGLKRWMLYNVHIVIPTNTHKKRTDKAIAGLIHKPVTLTETQIVELQKARDEFRASGNYKEADKIREQLLSAGLVVKDSKRIR